MRGVEKFDTPLVAVEKKSLAIHRCKHSACNLDWVSCRDGGVQLSYE
jgi:hypothetical protein